ncbi:RRS1 (predicted), partial [Pycnogonum litorale]
PLENMADVVKDVLKQVSEQNEKFKSTDVHKDIPLEIDIGNLLSVDSNPIDLSKFRSKKETFLKALTRDNTQLLINKIWELPSERHEDVIVAKLPEPTTIIPRINRLPKTRTLTKWQDFAKTKGIKKRKKDKLVWDKVVKDWRPRYGYKRVTSDTDNWVMEYKKNEDPYTDLFAKKAGEKSERVAKNELQRLRNIARSQNKRVPGVGLTPTETPDAAAVSKAIVVAKSSTASLGRYTETLPKEKPQKRTGAKRKFDPVIGDIRAEKLKNLEIFD